MAHRDRHAPMDHPALSPTACVSCGADPRRVAAGRAQLLNDAVYIEVAETFRALADSTRAKLVYSLLRQELCTCDLATIIDMSESVVSQHLRVLRQLRLVKSRRQGKQVFHTLDDAHIHILLAVCLSHVQDAARQHAGMESLLALFPPDHAALPDGAAPPWTRRHEGAH